MSKRFQARPEFVLLELHAARRGSKFRRMFIHELPGELTKDADLAETQPMQVCR